ncbi:CPCC family cysteine-rich protein [Azotosporobacter soli]|uniref:CPCC family cysteine-rich protein n=1 Tax=Azotosporobacter soli TaxID=3055040 RepID=UPI0031FECDD5
MTNSRDCCPCCGYLTLPKRMHPQMPQWDICGLCHWEDDGQTDRDADRVYGGPNQRYSLTEARANFKKYLIMYSPDNDTRIVSGDWPEEIEIKKSLIKLFEESKTLNNQCRADEIWEEIINLENKLDEITSLKINQFYKERNLED